MRFALIDSDRREAEPGLVARCPACERAMIAKCGEHKVWHWAHKGTRVCDVWWEPETAWHRSWKDRFPKEWQEVVRRADDGEKHIADVATAGGLVLEFQHSHLRKEERASREGFYRNMMWVVNGLRRVRDNPTFLAALRGASVTNLSPLTLSLPNKGALLRDWSGSTKPVFFDFGDVFESGHPLPFDAPVLWHLNPASPEGAPQLSPVPKGKFIEAALTGVTVGGIDLSGVAKHLKAAAQGRIREPLGFVPRARPRWRL